MACITAHWLLAWLVDILSLVNAPRLQKQKFALFPRYATSHGVLAPYNFSHGALTKDSELKNR